MTAMFFTAKGAALGKYCALVHCHSASVNFGSAIIVDVCNQFCPSDAAKNLSRIAV
jgi:hypothetical protein